MENLRNYIKKYFSKNQLMLEKYNKPILVSCFFNEIFLIKDYCFIAIYMISSFIIWPIYFCVFHRPFCITFRIKTVILSILLFSFFWLISVIWFLIVKHSKLYSAYINSHGMVSKLLKDMPNKDIDSNSFPPFSMFAMIGADIVLVFMIILRCFIKTRFKFEIPNYFVQINGFYTFISTAVQSAENEIFVFQTVYFVLSWLRMVSSLIIFLWINSIMVDKENSEQSIQNIEWMKLLFHRFVNVSANLDKAIDILSFDNITDDFRKEMLNKMTDQTVEISSLTKKFVCVLEDDIFNKDNWKKFDLVDAINDWIKHYPVDNLNKLRHLQSYDEIYSDSSVYMNKDALKDVINLILSNAKEHLYEDKKIGIMFQKEYLKEFMTFKEFYYEYGLGFDERSEFMLSECVRIPFINDVIFNKCMIINIINIVPTDKEQVKENLNKAIDLWYNYWTCFIFDNNKSHYEQIVYFKNIGTIYNNCKKNISLEDVPLSFLVISYLMLNMKCLAFCELHEDMFSWILVIPLVD